MMRWISIANSLGGLIIGVCLIVHIFGGVFIVDMNEYLPFWWKMVLAAYVVYGMIDVHLKHLLEKEAI